MHQQPSPYLRLWNTARHSILPTLWSWHSYSRTRMMRFAKNLCQGICPSWPWPTPGHIAISHSIVRHRTAARVYVGVMCSDSETRSHHCTRADDGAGAGPGGDADVGRRVPQPHLIACTCASRLRQGHPGRVTAADTTAQPDQSSCWNGQASSCQPSNKRQQRL